MYNKKGGLGDIVIGLLFFVMAMGVTFAMIPVMKVFIDMEQQSNNLNCYGYVHQGNVNNSLSFNATLNNGNSGSPLGCVALSGYIPFVLIIFLIFGVMEIIYGKAQDYFGGGSGYSQ